MNKVEWFEPRLFKPPHRVTHIQRLEWMVGDMLKGGWRSGKQALLGYSMPGERHQLISGSHRWHAAMLAGIQIPVLLMDYHEMYSIWGTDNWLQFIANPPIITECYNDVTNSDWQDWPPHDMDTASTQGESNV